VVSSCIVPIPQMYTDTHLFRDVFLECSVLFDMLALFRSGGLALVHGRRRDAGNSVLDQLSTSLPSLWYTVVATYACHRVSKRADMVGKDADALMFLESGERLDEGEEHQFYLDGKLGLFSIHARWY
jgi:hypothetical protein